MQSIISVSNLVKTYAGGFQALKNVDLEIRRGEIFALLGPNGAGKTTLISIICGIVNPTGGTVIADGHDIIRAWRAARLLIGLVPQELSSNAFESPLAALAFSRGLFGKGPNPAHLEKVLSSTLSGWDQAMRGKAQRTEKAQRTRQYVSIFQAVATPHRALQRNLTK